MAAEDLLRQARLERGITLEQVILSTRLRRSFAERIDEGRFSELPPGVYARGYLRAFAIAVGADPEAILSQLSDALPEPADPLPLLRELAKERTPPSVLAFVTERLESWRRNDRARWLLRHLAAFVDALLLLFLNAIVVWAVARTCGVGVGALLNAAGGALASIAVVTFAIYFLLLAGVGGCTPGGWLCGVGAPADRTPLDLRSILRRAWQSG